jgi:hypothetical protein
MRTATLMRHRDDHNRVIALLIDQVEREVRKHEPPRSINVHGIPIRRGCHGRDGKFEFFQKSFGGDPASFGVPIVCSLRIFLGGWK